jgi:glycosyltransferase involved in cell wall biosynthesis
MSLISEIPKPEKSNSGWPWTEVSNPLPPTMPDGTPWPKISIVTPSYNQGQYLEETIRSVLLQNYPNLEYIIIDGGSTDNSVEIIKKYEPWLTYWESEQDRGQPHAITKGFERSTGEIMAWINSDDFYAPDALSAVARAFSQIETKWVTGISYIINADGVISNIFDRPVEDRKLWYKQCLYSQPSVFWQQDLWLKVGGIDESLQFAFDYDLWLKFVQIQPFAYWVDQQLSFFRHHFQSKSIAQPKEFKRENVIILKKYLKTSQNLIILFQTFKSIREKKLSYMLSLNHENKFKKAFLLLTIAPWIIPGFFCRKLKDRLFSDYLTE